MYTFNPLSDIPVDHTGFVLVCIIAIVMLVMVAVNGIDSFFGAFFVATITVGIAYGVSYHFTNQSVKTFVNEKVTAEFAGYAPEGYREKSGKSYVDRHFVYVVYTVNSDPVLLQAQAGIVYPKRAILYKN